MSWLDLKSENALLKTRQNENNIWQFNVPSHLGIIYIYQKFMPNTNNSYSSPEFLNASFTQKK